MTSLQLFETEAHWHKSPALPSLVTVKQNVSRSNVFAQALSSCDWIQFLPIDVSALHSRNELFAVNTEDSQYEDFKELVRCGTIGIHWFDATSREFTVDIQKMLTKPQSRFANPMYLVQARAPPSTLQYLLHLEFFPWFNKMPVHNRVLLNLPSRLILGVNQLQTCALPQKDANGLRQITLGVTQSGAQARYNIVSGVISVGKFENAKESLDVAQPKTLVYVHLLVLERL